MEFISEFLVEAFFELFGEGFVYLCTAFVPDKQLSHKAHRAIVIVSFIIAIVLLVGLFVGIYLLITSRGQSILGWILISLSVLYIVVGIVCKIVSRFS